MLLAPPVAVSASAAESFASIAPPPAADLRSLDFDVYGLAGLTPTVVGNGGRREKVDRVTLAFVTGDGPITVGTDSRAPLTSSAELARQALDALLHARESSRPDWPHLSESAYGLWLNGRARARAAAAAAASAGDLTLPVDGTPTRCVSVTDGERFAAVARLSAATITIAGRGDPARLALETLPEDMLRRLAGS